MLNWNTLFATVPSVLTVVGMAKNVGKTVTMNYLQDLLLQEGRSLGLLSVGLDGEKFDSLTKLQKPAVTVTKGTVVATAEQALTDWQAWDLLSRTTVDTPIGKVVILRAREKTEVLLAGPSKNCQVQTIVAILRSFGADSILIDGAFDRQSSADPSVSQQMILASGAALVADLNRLCLLTQCRVEQLTLPECPVELRSSIPQSTAKIILVTGRQATEVPAMTTLLEQSEWAALLQTSCEALILRGAVGDALAKALLALDKPPLVVVQDGSKLFISAELWRRLRYKNIQFGVERAIKLLAVTVNPCRPGEKGLDPNALLAALGAALFPLPVLDIVREKQYRQAEDS